MKSNMLVFAQARLRRQRLTEAASIHWCRKALPGCIPISVIVTFLADYLATDQGMAVEDRATAVRTL